MVFAVGCGDRVVAVDDHSDHPAAVERLPRVGGMNPSIESILAVRPGVVVASSAGRYDALATELARRGVSFIALRTDRLSGIPAAIEHLQRTLGCGAGNELVERIHEMAAAPAPPPDAPKVLLVASHDPLYVAGHATFADDLLRAAGLRNALPDTVIGWPQYSIESLLAEPPDVVLVMTSEDRWPALQEALRTAAGWRRLDAVREGRIGFVDDSVVARPGPRVIESRDLIRTAVDDVLGR